MPRRSRGPRLYLDPERKTWVIRDGRRFIRTGCPDGARGLAERKLGEYIAKTRQPTPSATPLLADVLLVYMREHAMHMRSAGKIKHTVKNLGKWWGGEKRVTDVTAKNCRAYAAERPPVAARRDLETLRAAIKHWHREYGPLPAVPAVTLPENPAPRERWLTRSEAAKLLRAARHVPHLARFILLGLYTGSRSGAILAAPWNWVDFDHALMRRRAPGEKDSSKRRPPARLEPRIIAHLRRWRRLDLALERRQSGADMLASLRVCHYDGAPVTKLRRSWLSAVKRAGLAGKVTPHTLRHTRATWMVQGEWNIWDAAEQLGMSPLVLQRTYGHHRPSWGKPS